MPILKPEKRGDSWRVRVYIGDKRYKSVTAPTKAEAIAKAEELQSALRNAPSEALGNDMTVAEAMERYVEAKKGTLSPSSYKEFTRIRLNNMKDLHDIKLQALTQEQVQISIGIESATHAPKTVRCMHGLLSSTLKMFRPEFPLHTRLPQNQKNEIVIPSESTVIALLNYVRGDPLDAPVHLAALCGLRKSEILGLKWSCVDFDKKTIDIVEAKVGDINGEIVVKATKTTSGTRKLKMLPAVEQSLRRAKDKSHGEYVTELTSAGLYRRYKTAISKTSPNDCDYTFHALRHYCASVMIMLGIPIKYIADYLGHETEDMVNRVYGHIMTDKKDELFARLEDYYNARLPKS